MNEEVDLSSVSVAPKELRPSPASDGVVVGDSDGVSPTRNREGGGGEVASATTSILNPRTFRCCRR